MIVPKLPNERRQTDVYENVSRRDVKPMFIAIYFKERRQTDGNGYVSKKKNPRNMWIYPVHKSFVDRRSSFLQRSANAYKIIPYYRMPRHKSLCYSSKESATKYVHPQPPGTATICSTKLSAQHGGQGPLLFIV